MGARDDCAPGVQAPEARGSSENTERAQSTPAAWRSQTPPGLLKLVDAWRVVYPHKPLTKNTQKALAFAWKRAA